MIVDGANAFGNDTVEATNLENVGCAHISDFSQRYDSRQQRVVDDVPEAVVYPDAKVSGQIAVTLGWFPGSETCGVA